MNSKMREITILRGNVIRNIGDRKTEALITFEDIAFIFGVPVVPGAETKIKIPIGGKVILAPGTKFMVCSADGLRWTYHYDGEKLNLTY